MLLSKKPEIFSPIFIALLQSTEDFACFEKKDPLHSLNISAVVDPEKCGYFNARKLVSCSTLREPTFSRVLNTAETCIEALFS